MVGINYSESEGETIATQSSSEGWETPETVTVTNSSSDNNPEEEEEEVTFTCRLGLEEEQCSNNLLFSSLNSDMAVKFWWYGVVLLTRWCKVEGEGEGEEGGE